MLPRLLLVEDDPTSRAFLLAAAEALPARVEAADSVSATMALAECNDYALWMIDAHLPDGSGIELLAGLRARGLRTPALAHTASREQRDLDALLAAGFVAALSKPLSAGQWRAALHDALSGRPGASRATTREEHGNAAIPLWDDAAALAAMNGNRTHVDALRNLFLAELSGVRTAVESAFSANDTDALSSALHRLRASCGFTGAKRLEAAALHLHADGGSAQARADFLAALQDTASSS